MKILKRPDNVIFDTDNPDSTESRLNLEPSTPLHHMHDQSDWDFLTDQFGTDHPVFQDFGRSYYYVLTEI